MTVNANQPEVDRHQDDVQHQEPSINVCRNSNAGTSKQPDSVFMGNHTEPEEVNEISTNYINSGESYNTKTTLVDTYFSSKIAKTLQLDPEPKSMKECLKRSDWPQWKEAIEAEQCSLNKREVFSKVIPTPHKVFPVGAKWVFVQK
jgi:hypothetical protein